MTTRSARGWAAAAAAIVGLSTATASRSAWAQDPPPPPPPNDAPPDAPPPPLTPDAPPRFDPPPRQDMPPGLTPVNPGAPPPVPETPVPDAPPVTGAKSGAASRTLRGHKFIPPFHVDSVFITTTVGLTTEIGHEWSPSIPTSGSDMTMTSNHESSYNLSAGAVGQYASLGIAVNDRVQLAVDASYTTLFGVDPSSILIYGNQSEWHITPGVRTRLWSSDSTQIGLHFYAAFGQSSQLSPSNILGEIANEAQQIGASTNRQACLVAGDLGCALTNASFNAAQSLATTKTTYGGGIAFNVAHAFNSIFGVQASTGIEVGYATNSIGSATAPNTFGSVPVAFHIGFAPSLDFGPNVPISLMAEYQFTVIEEPGLSSDSVDAATQQTLRNDFAFGVYYTGRPNLAVGARLNARLDQQSVSIDSADPTTGDTTTATGQQPLARVMGQLTARYFF